MDTAERIGEISRETKETQIRLKLNLDGPATIAVDTGLPFLDHMLELFARHGCFGLEVEAKGDLEVDYHHLVEDVGIVLGEACKVALGEQKGLTRYGFFLLPMDEVLARVALDLSGRALFVYKVETMNPYVRDFNILMLKEFFQAFANSCGANLHILLEYGFEPHHIAEAQFKAFGRALDAATQLDPRLGDTLPSTKEAL